ncbi:MULTISPECIES: rhamnulokinase [Clostridia]|uniref:rhamnulokinase n=1 Tax=Clostridia TaxID=186801 RepID=UPI00067ED2A6|nr:MULTISPECIES: rhamnulokinase [Clostridia]
MTSYYLAIDIGASSGRHILGHIDQNQKMVLEEIYRFPNRMVQKNGRKIWETDRLFREIKDGMKKCRQLQKVPVSVGIDTWGVDCVFLGTDGNRLGEAVGYRDSRTKGMDIAVRKVVSDEFLFQKTGIQKQIFNTLYQLMAVREKEPDTFKKMENILMIPDFFHYLLTGEKAAEYTNATTTQLIEPYKRKWNHELMEALGLSTSVFPELIYPGTLLGRLKKDVQEEVGFDCYVTVPATHDTASAVAAVPSCPGEDAIYISSGTWSLIGTEEKRPICTEEARLNNFTNEGGCDARYRFLKNIMGMWMIQCIQKELAPEQSFEKICSDASKESIRSIVDCSDERFLAPASMAEEIWKACKESGQEIPAGISGTACVIYNSLAQCYAETVKRLENITHKIYKKIYIVGGGSKADYLNQLTATMTGKTVCAGPAEATAIGNLAVQMVSHGEFADLQEAKNCIRNSYEVVTYHS